MKKLRLFGAASACLISLSFNNAQAIVVTQNTDASTLADALTSGSIGFTVVNSNLSTNNDGVAVGSGTYSNASGTYGIGPGVLLSSGNVSDYGDGPDTIDNSTFYGVSATAAQEDLLDPITGGSYSHYDVSQLDIDFTTTTGDVFFNVVFGSEEFDTYVGDEFIDGFGLYLDGINIADVGGQPVNINHPDMAFLPGTELNGILAPGGNPVMSFSASGLNTSIEHSLTFIVADTSDEELDTTVYLASLGGTAPEVPVPAAIWLFGSGLLGLVGMARRKKAV